MYTTPEVMKPRHGESPEEFVRWLAIERGLTLEEQAVILKRLRLNEAYSPPVLLNEEQWKLFGL